MRIVLAAVGALALGAAAPADGPFKPALGKAVLVSKLINVELKSQDQFGALGTVKDVAIADGKVAAYVVTLNDGRTVAIAGSAVTIAPPAGRDGVPELTTAATTDQIAQAPALPAG